MRGRKPESAERLALRGSHRAKSRTAEPRGPDLAGDIDPPTWLNAAAREKWAALWPILKTMGTMSAADVDNLAVYCMSFARWQKAETELARHGEVITHRNGVEGLSHWLRVSESALDRMSKAGAEIGLSASTRPRLKAEAKPDAKPATGKARFFQIG